MTLQKFLEDLITRQKNIVAYQEKDLKEVQQKLMMFEQLLEELKK